MKQLLTQSLHSANKADATVNYNTGALKQSEIRDQSAVTFLTISLGTHQRRDSCKLSELRLFAKLVVPQLFTTKLDGLNTPFPNSYPQICTFYCFAHQNSELWTKKSVLLSDPNMQ